MSIRKCWVDGCQSSANREQDRGVTYHKLPKNSLLLEKWLLQTHLNRETDKKWCFICSRHFRKVDFELYKASKFVLKADAIPTIFSWGVTPLEDLNNIFASLDSSKLPPDTSENEENLTASDKDKVDDSNSTENIPVCANTEDCKNETIAQNKIDDENNVKIELTEKPPSDEKDTVETPSNEPVESIENVSKNDEIENPSLNKDVNETIVDSKPSKTIEETPPVPDAPVEPELSIPHTPENMPENNTTLPEIDSIFQNLFQEQKLNKSIHTDDLSFINKGFSDDDKLQELDLKSEEIIHNSMPPKSDIKPRVKLPVGRPRRRSPNNHKSAIPSKKKIERRKRFVNPAASPDEKCSSVQIKLENGTLIQGSRVEAKDFNDHWYPARVVEVDHEELEVLIHYDNWSQRFDEWISMHSPRLRLINGPPPVASVTPPSFKVGERCLARWSNNQRFPATVQKVLQNGKYEVMFDDGLTRTIKWAMMTKVTKPSHRRTLASGSPNVTSPTTPKTDADVSPSVNATPPIHNHLFDPKRDHLGTKEERRHLKRRLDVKELFFARKKRKGSENEMLTKKSLNLNDGRRRKRKLKLSEGDDPTEKNLKNPRKSIHRKNNLKLSQPDLSMKSDSSTISLSPRASSLNLDLTPTTDVFSTSDNKMKSPTRTLQNLVVEYSASSPVTPTGNKPHKSDSIAKSPLSSPKSTCDIVKTEPDAFIKLEQDTHAHTQSPFEPSMENTSRPATITSPQSSKLPSFSAIRNSTQSPSPKIMFATSEPPKPLNANTPNSPTTVRSSHKSNTSVKQATANSMTSSSKILTTDQKRLTNKLMLRAADKDWCCRWVNGQPVGTVLEPEPSKDLSVSRVTVQVEDVRLPPNWNKLLTRRTIGTTEGKWDVVLVCPSGRRYRTRGEMQERLKESDHAELEPFALGLMDFSAHRKQARRRGLDVLIPNAKPVLSTVYPPPSDVSPNAQLGGQVVNPCSPLIGLSTPHGDNFVYIGSLKVEIIENLLRCPKEGCFKNFRKENLLQMHIKHYHPELCKFFGDTPNVADLAYARTVVEEPTTPVNRPREKRVSEMQHARTDFDVSAIKVESLDMDGMATPSMYDNRMNMFGDHNVVVKNEPWNDDNECHENTWHVSKSKTPSKPKEQFSGGNLQHISNKQKNSAKSFPSKSNILDEFNHSHKSYQGEDSDLFNKRDQSYYPTYDYTPYKAAAPTVVKRSHKKKVPTVIDNPAVWNMLTPEHDESRSSFEVSDRVGINGRLVENIKKEEKDDSNQSTIITETGEKIKIVHMKREEIINCHCRFGEEDGLMIQCELCLCWQHAICHNIERESEVPEKYICRICLNPYRGRRSQKYLNDQDWLYEGRLPRISSTQHPTDVQRSNLLRKSHELAANLLQLKDLMHSLRCKMEVAEKKDHPKLYLWSKPWEHNADVGIDKSFKDLNGESMLDSVVMKNDIMPQNVNDIKMESGDLMNIESSIDLIKESIEGDIDQLAMDVPNVDVFASSILDIKKTDDIKVESDDIESDVKCDLANGSSPTSLFPSLLASPGGTSLELPLTKTDLETLVKTVQMAVPQPEAAIEPSDCRLRLLQYIERTQHLLSARLDSIEAQIAELESQDPLLDEETPDNCPRTKETIQMLLRDLATLEELGTIC